MFSFENNPIIEELKRRLEKCKVVGGGKNTALNFRCPLCGDSERHKNKRRGYIYQKDGGVWFCCFNCSTNMSLRNFLKETEPDLFQLWNLQRIKEKQRENGIEQREDVSYSIKGLIPLKTLPHTHPAFQYVLKRKIPTHKYQFIFYSKELDKILQCPFNEGIVFTDSSKLFVARNIDPQSKYRYITKKVEDGAIFGEHYLNPECDVKIVEGLIDSLFLHNCVPALNSNLESLAKKYPRIILIWDNEPRNAEICAKMEKALKNGHKIVVWPESVKEYKDVNEMVLAGVDVEEIVLKNNFKGIMGLLKLNLWKRVQNDFFLQQSKPAGSGC